PLGSLFRLTSTFSTLKLQQHSFLHQSLPLFGEKKMADGFGYGGFSGVPYPFWLSSPSSHPPATAPPFLASHPVESYDPTQRGFDPMTSHGSYHRSPADWSNNPAYGDNSRSQTPSSSFYADNSRPGNFGPRGEDSYKDMYSPSGFYSRESSSDFVPLPTENFSERQRLNLVPTYNSATSATVSSLADMLIRNSQEPFYKPIMPSDVYASSNAFDEKRPGHYHPGYDKPVSMNAVSGTPVEPYVRVTDSIPLFPMSSLKTEAHFDGSQTGIHLGDGGSFNRDVYNNAPDNTGGVQSSLHGSSIDPVNFDVLLGYGEATGHAKPLSENPDLHNQIVGSPGSKSPRSYNPLRFDFKSPGPLFKKKREGSEFSLYQKPSTLVADSENADSERSLKNAIEDLNCDEHISWSHFMMVPSEGLSAPIMGSESCGELKADNGDAQSAVNYNTSFEGSDNQPSEDVQAKEKPCKLQEQMFEIMNREKKTALLTDMGLKGICRSNADEVSTGQSPERHLCDQGDITSRTSSPRVSSVVNAMHNLSEVLLYECFSNGSSLKLEERENLDKVVDNLTKCLKKLTGNKTLAVDASLPTQALHVSCPNVVDLNEASNVVAKDVEGFNVKLPDSFGFKEPVDKNEMTQSIKNILASNFPDGEENHPQTLLYKNLWLDTEAALCSTSCMARYHRIKNEIGSVKSQNIEISADASIYMQEPFLNPEKSVPIINNVEQETAESLIKHGRNCGNNVVTTSHDAPQSSRFNSDPVDAVLSLMSRSFMGALEPNIDGNFKPDATSGKIPDAIQKESSTASTTEDKHNDVIDRFQILKHQETKRKLKSQNCPDTDIGQFQILKQTKMGVQEDNPEASKMANIGKSGHVSDVMDRFQILKSREAAEQVLKSLNRLDIDSDSDADSDQPRRKTQMRGDLESGWRMTRLCEFSPQIGETCVDTEAGKGYESPTSDWEHVRKDD
ncbi:unnamed protein product, partial [Thlaspi arvense]